MHAEEETKKATAETGRMKREEEEEEEENKSDGNSCRQSGWLLRHQSQVEEGTSRVIYYM